MKPSGGELPISYRQEEVGFVLNRVAAGESCSLIGVSSTGKSNFFRFLLREDVQANYIGDSANTYLFVLLDSNFLSVDGVSEWTVYELAFHRLLSRMERLSIDKADIRHFDDLYQRMVTKKDTLLGQRYLERLLAFLIESGYRLVFLFDEFDEIARRFDRRFFLNLRAIRDEFKYHLMYVVASRDELARLREDITDIEAFYELLSINICGLKPYNQADSLFMLQRLAKRRDTVLPDTAASALIAASGGHPGILRAVFWLATDDCAEPQLEPAQLIDNAGVWDECLKIWDSLGQDEQTTLSLLAADPAGAMTDEKAAALLVTKGLLIKNPSGVLELFCPIFRLFVDQHQDSSERGLNVDQAKALVWVEGRQVSGLSKLEFDLLCFMFNKPGQVCSRDELILALYSEEEILTEGVPDNRIDTLIGRVREKIEPNRSKPRYIKTVRGHGYKLAE